MLYLLYGTEDFLIEHEVNKIKDEYKLDNLSISRYDASIDNLKDILDDCQTISLFEEQKMVVVDNALYFNRVKTNNALDEKLILDYFNHYNPNTILIFISRNNSIDNNKKVTKKVKENGKIISLEKTDTITFIKKIFDDYQITNANCEYLVSRVGNDLAILYQEIEKLKCYKADDKKITEEDIKECATYNIDTDMFKFIDNIVARNKENALITYHELLNNNEEPIKIIILLAAKFRLMYQVICLSKKGYSVNEIANELEMHVYPVKLALKASLHYSESMLLNFLKKLADLDEDIKTGKIDAQLGLELFIINV